MVRIKASVGLIRRPGFWAPGDSLILGKAHRGLVVKRVRDRHLGSNDLPMRPYNPRYSAWKRSWLSADKAHKVQSIAQQVAAKKKPGKRIQAALSAAVAAFDAIPSEGPLPVDITLTGQHLDGLAVIEYDEAGWVLATDAVNAKTGEHYSAIQEKWRPHLAVSPSDARVLTGIALKIIRRRCRAMRGGKAPK